MNLLKRNKVNGNKDATYKLYNHVVLENQRKRHMQRVTHANPLPSAPDLCGQRKRTEEGRVGAPVKTEEQLWKEISRHFLQF